MPSEYYNTANGASYYLPDCRWTEKVESIQKQSPHGRRKGWGCKCVIVKSGDDCRQELLAIQLIETFQQIFHEAKLPLWVRPYEVLVTSNRTALIEFIPDSLSIHTIKHRSPAGTSLSQHFFNKFKRGTPECLRAQRCFVESTAAYSIISYLLQVCVQKAADSKALMKKPTLLGREPWDHFLFIHQERSHSSDSLVEVNCKVHQPAQQILLFVSCINRVCCINHHAVNQKRM